MDDYKPEGFTLIMIYLTLMAAALISIIAVSYASAAIDTKPAKPTCQLSRKPSAFAMLTLESANHQAFPAAGVANGKRS